MDFEERVAWIINLIKDREGLNNIQIGQMLGVNKNTILAYSKGRGDLKGVALAGIVKNFGISGEWLIAGKGEPFPGARVKYPEVCGSEPEQIELDADVYSYIPKYNARLSGGSGSFETSKEIENYCAFRTEWLKRKWNIKSLALFEVTGDSMAPLIQHQDVVLVDMSRNNLEDIIDGKIYAFSEDHVVRIKRLVRKGTELWAISDNKIEAPDSRIELEEGTFNLIGKVVWIGHEVR